MQYDGFALPIIARLFDGEPSDFISLALCREFQKFIPINDGHVKLSRFI